MPGPEPVPRDMRQRLLTNRQGKLTTDQWRDIVTEPLSAILILLGPVLVVLGARLLLNIRGFFFILLVVALVVTVPTLFRAFRYARAPVNFAELYAGDRPVAHLFFWQPLELYTPKGEALRFKKRLAPRLPLQPNQAYLVYYLQDPKDKVLLSYAPARHPDSDSWRPGESFDSRKKRRGGS